MTNLQIARRWLPFLIFLISFLVTVFFCVFVLANPGNPVKGILVFEFGNSSVFLPAVLSPDLSHLTLPHDILPSVTQILENALPTIVTDIIPSALKDLEQALPLNCSLGTKSFCIGFKDRIDCRSLPMNISREISQIIPGEILKLFPSLATQITIQLASVDQRLTWIQENTLASYVITSLSATCFHWVSTLVLWKIKKDSDWQPHRDRFRTILLHAFTFASSLCSLVALLVPTVILYVLISQVQNSPLQLLTHKGPVSNDLPVALGGSVVLVIVSSMIWRGWTHSSRDATLPDNPWLAKA